MPTNPYNSLISVQTLATLMASRLSIALPLIGTANKRFMNFQKEPAQFGDTISFRRPTYVMPNEGIVALDSPYQQRYVQISADYAITCAVTLSEVEQTFYDLDSQSILSDKQVSFLDGIVRSCEYQFGKHITGTGYGMKQDSKLGAPISKVYHTESGPVHWFGDETLPFLSYKNYLQAYKIFKKLGTFAPSSYAFYDEVVGIDIKEELLKQYAPKRNDREAVTWEVADMQEVKFTACTWLPTHIAGYVGQKKQTLTIKSLIQDAGSQRIIGFVCGGVTDVGAKTEGRAASITKAVVMGDIGRVIDEPGKPVLSAVEVSSGMPVGIPVQFKVEDDADSDASGDVSILIGPYPFNFLSNIEDDPQKNFTGGDLVGRKIIIKGSHAASAISSDGHYFAAPALAPIAAAGGMSAVATDATTGLSVQVTIQGDGYPATNSVIFRILTGGIWIPGNTIRMISAIVPTPMT